MAGLEEFPHFSSAKRKWPGAKKFCYYRGLPVITDIDPQAQIRLRGLMAPAFSVRRLIAIEANIKKFVAKQLETIAAGEGDFNAEADLAQPMAAFNSFAPGAPPPTQYHKQLGKYDE